MSHAIAYINKKDLKYVYVSSWQVKETMEQMREDNNLMVLFLDGNYVDDTDE